MLRASLYSTKKKTLLLNELSKKISISKGILEELEDQKKELENNNRDLKNKSKRFCQEKTFKTKIALQYLWQAHGRSRHWILLKIPERLVVILENKKMLSKKRITMNWNSSLYCWKLNLIIIIFLTIDYCRAIESSNGRSMYSKSNNLPNINTGVQVNYLFFHLIHKIDRSEITQTLKVFQKKLEF